jgi:hypothetical protein
MTAPDASWEPDGAGVAAGQTVLLSLAVCESIALEAIQDPMQRSGAVLQTRRLKGRASEALEISARAYARARAELDITLLEGAGSNPRATGRDATLRRALVDAADSLIALAAAAADTAVLAAALTETVEPSRRPDAAGCAELTLGAVRCVRHLVEVNLALTRGDDRRIRTVELISVAEQAATAARRTLEDG